MNTPEEFEEFLERWWCVEALRILKHVVARLDGRPFRNVRAAKKVKKQPKEEEAEAEAEAETEEGEEGPAPAPTTATATATATAATATAAAPPADAPADSSRRVPADALRVNHGLLRTALAVCGRWAEQRRASADYLDSPRRNRAPLASVLERALLREGARDPFDRLHPALKDPSTTTTATISGQCIPSSSCIPFEFDLELAALGFPGGRFPFDESGAYVGGVACLALPGGGGCGGGGCGGGGGDDDENEGQAANNDGNGNGSGNGSGVDGTTPGGAQGGAVANPNAGLSSNPNAGLTSNTALRKAERRQREALAKETARQRAAWDWACGCGSECGSGSGGGSGGGSGSGSVGVVAAGAPPTPLGAALEAEVRALLADLEAGGAALGADADGDGDGDGADGQSTTVVKVGDGQGAASGLVGGQNGAAAQLALHGEEARNLWIVKVGGSSEWANRQHVDRLTSPLSPLPSPLSLSRNVDRPAVQDVPGAGHQGLRRATGAA
jgi:hypothetical protein